MNLRGKNKNWIKLFFLGPRFKEDLLTGLRRTKLKEGTALLSIIKVTGKTFVKTQKINYKGSSTWLCVNLQHVKLSKMSESTIRYVCNHVDTEMAVNTKPRNQIL